jgi:hypothetical protein
MNVTQILIVLCVLVFFGQAILGTSFENFFVLRGIDLGAEPYLILTSMFAHGGLQHLFFNMFALFIFGSALEKKIGSGNFLLLYIISGILGGIGFMLLGTPFSSALGASGAIYGIIGAVAFLMPNMRIFLMGIPMPMYIAGFLYMAIELFSLGASDGIAHSAHLLGLFGGVAIAYLFKQIHMEFDIGKAAAAGIVFSLLAGFAFGAYYGNADLGVKMLECREGTVADAALCYLELAKEYKNQPTERDMICKEHAKYQNYMKSGNPDTGGQAYADCMGD